MKINLPVKGIASTMPIEYCMFGPGIQKMLFYLCYSDRIL